MIFLALNEMKGDDDICRLTEEAGDSPSELLDNDLMITRVERRYRRIGFGAMAAGGLVGTFAAPDKMGVVIPF